MVKKLAIGLFVLTCTYVLVSGDYTFVGLGYRLLGYGRIVATSFSEPRPTVKTDVATDTEDERPEQAAREPATDTEDERPKQAAREPATDTKDERPEQAAREPATTISSTTHESALVHLASLRSPDSAEKEWSRLQQAYPAELSQLDVIVERVNLGVRGVFYRVLADTAQSPFSPQQLCAALRQAEQFCSTWMPNPANDRS